jgi:uncharacterized protein (TIGR02145 family)
MKRTIVLIILLLFCATSLFAQAPEKFSYQAVVRNASNALVSNAPVGLRVSILQGSASGNAEYVETHTATTNANGLLTVEIGGGTVQQGVFTGIDWANGLYFLKTETDPNGGDDYIITSVQQLLSVPYAFYAKEAGNGFSGDYNDLTNKPTIPQSVGELTNDANYITMDSVPTNVSAYTNDAGYITLEQVPAQENADWNAIEGAAQILNKPELFSGDYNDLINKPTIPTVPTNVSAFNNDAGYLTSYIEQQILTISNDTIFLTGGSFVKLPTTEESDTTEMVALLAQMEQLQRPSVSTLSVNNVSYNEAYLTGRLFNSGIYWISDCGFCWSTAQNPTLANNHITAASDLGTFGLNLTNLDAGTTYYVRAYATNSAGTTYGEQLSFTTTSATLPMVTTDMVSYITTTTAMCGGDVISDEGATVTARGVCWSTTQNPTVNDNHTTDGSGTGSFISSINGLTSGTTYYVRAYATNSQGIAYGEQRSFTTAYYSNFCPGTPTVTDHEGNVYNTVQIGGQCWTRENLRTTTSPSTGTYLIPAAGIGSTHTGKQAFWYNNDPATYAPMNYGLLYNWNAAVDTFNTAYGETSVNTSSGNAVFVTFSGHRRGICPEGWHLPSDAEWTTLTNYVGSQSEYVCESNTTYIAKALASEAGWDSFSGECYPGDQSVTANNASGFGAVPAGFCCGSSFDYAGFGTYFWSATQNSGYDAYYRDVYYINPYVNRYNGGKNYGFSVRCLRD